MNLLYFGKNRVIYINGVCQSNPIKFLIGIKIFKIKHLI